MQTINLLIGVTGSVATIKLPLLIKRFKETFTNNAESTAQLNIRVVMTEHSKHFCDPGEISDDVEVFTDDMEWTSWRERGDPVLHIELAKWAHLMLIAPLDANTLAKISQGLCDNLLTCILRAWIFPKPLLFCPAMNTKMWEHPITSQQVGVLKGWGFSEIPCVSKQLMCGDTGLGAMAEVDTIVEKTAVVIKTISSL